MEFQYEFQENQMSRIADIMQRINELRGQVDNAEEATQLEALVKLTTFAAGLALATQIMKKM